jgi:predicted nucleic acid-binding protein
VKSGPDGSGLRHGAAALPRAHRLRCDSAPIFGRVVTARVVVEQDLAAPHTPEPVRHWAASAPPWLEILEPKHVEHIPALGRQGPRGDGDRAIISLAPEEAAVVVVMDDMKARREAKKRGLKPIWTLEVLEEAAARGLMSDLTQRLEHLEHRTSFYVGDKAKAVIEGMKTRDRQRQQSGSGVALPAEPSQD